MTKNAATGSVPVSTLATLSQWAYQPAGSASLATGLPAVSVSAPASNLIHPQVVSDGAGNIIVAFRGTDAKDANDLAADKDIINGVVPKAALDALAYVQQIQRDNPGANIIVTGHSLGGYEAQYVEASIAKLASVGEAVNNVSAVSFNAPGLPAGVVFWAFADAEVEARLAAGGAKLRPQDWKSGDRLWVIDILAPFGGADAMLADLKEKVFPAREARYRGLVEGKIGVRVV